MNKSNQPHSSNELVQINKQLKFDKMKNTEVKNGNVKQPQQGKEILTRGGKIVKTNKYVVETVCFDLKTTRPICYGFEIIDLMNNRLFKDVKTEWDLEDQFENYWNRVNPIESSWYTEKRTEIIKVIDVFPNKEFKKRFPKEWYEIYKENSIVYTLK